MSCCTFILRFTGTDKAGSHILYSDKKERRGSNDKNENYGR